MATAKGAYDRGRKFQHYRTLPSLIEYLTIEQDEPHIEHWTRQREDDWDFVAFDDLGQCIQLTSIGCVLPFADVYDRIEWARDSSKQIVVQRFTGPSSTRGHQPDVSMHSGLCQPPSEAIIVLASFGPQVPRL